MASPVGICNRALQKLGAKRITSLTQDSPTARACNVAYEPVLLRLYRKHAWNFAIKRATLAADATAPDWGRANAFELPSNFVRLLSPYPEDNTNTHDHQIEGRKIYTNDSGPLYIRYIWHVTDTNLMDPLFRELFATELALELCEELTQSNTKKESLRTDLTDIMREARKANAFEKVSAEFPEDTWITVRA